MQYIFQSLNIEKNVYILGASNLSPLENQVLGLWRGVPNKICTPYSELYLSPGFKKKTDFRKIITDRNHTAVK